MASRNFCDLCDEEIKSGSPYYGVETMIVRSGSNSSRYATDSSYEEFHNGRQVITKLEHKHSMTCHRCILAIAKAILSLRKDSDS